VQPLLDAVIDFLPSPLDVPPIPGSSAALRAEETARGDPRGRPTTSRSPALASRSWPTPFVGKLTFFRVYSGRLEAAPDPQRRTRARRSASGAS
jgi:elongation factor G